MELVVIIFVDIAQLGSGCNQEQQLWVGTAAAQIGFSLLGISFCKTENVFSFEVLNVSSTTNLPCSFLFILLPDRIILTDNSQKRKRAWFEIPQWLQNLDRIIDADKGAIANEKNS